MQEGPEATRCALLPPPQKLRVGKCQRSEMHDSVYGADVLQHCPVYTGCSEIVLTIQWIKEQQ